MSRVALILAIAWCVWWYRKNGGDAPLFQLLQDLKNMGV